MRVTQSIFVGIYNTEIFRDDYSCLINLRECDNKWTQFSGIFLDFFGLMLRILLYFHESKK